MVDLEVAPGWQVTVQTETGGRLVGVVWDGGSIPVGQFTEFGLRAQNPEREVELRWTVIQTYADGTEVQWVGPANAEFPAATTRVRSSDPIGSVDAVAAVAALLALVALLVSGLAWRRLTSLKSYQGNQRRSSTSPRR